MNEFNILDKDSLQLKTKYVIATTMLVVGILMLVTIRTKISCVFIAASILLFYAATAKRRDRDKELGKISDMKAFEAELERAVKYFDMGLMLTDSYAVVVRPSLRVYAFDDMAKFEVGIAEDKEKALFLTDGNGGRYRIARTVTGDGNQSDFDEAYRIVKSKFTK
ncbi:hypothetical protein [Mogibacterium pumilum]|uniref:Uncharacterized protein n=1 Tax=Mogibacterium pumilum TaxID=86332 RepID=A0A223ARW7_9FIRM|nr:hypothetical protein [Mogibacterium pumilum]ASS37713.1 hypothetical protein AXF17_04095 [Mogibacterium pumilum]